MNVLQVTFSSQLVGGAERYVFDVTPALHQHGHRVAVAYVGGASEPRLSRFGVREYWLAQHGSDVATLVRALRATADAEQPDVIVLHTNQHPQLLDASTAFAPTVEFVHNHDSYCASGEKVLWNSRRVCERESSLLPCLLNHVAERCGSLRPQRALSGALHARATLASEKRLAGLITASAFVRDQLIRHGVFHDRVTVVPYPAPALTRTMPSAQAGDAETPDELPSGPRFLFVGRLVRAKGLDVLLDALKLTPNHIHLDVAGDGWYKPALLRRTTELALSNRVQFHGWTDGAALSRLYQRCRAAVVPSVWPEPFGIVALEAMQHARPVVISSAGGLPEVVPDTVAGFVVPPFDVSALAARIAVLAEDADLARRMGEAGRQHVQQHFGMDIHLQRLTDVLKRAVRSASVPA